MKHEQRKLILSGQTNSNTGFLLMGYSSNSSFPLNVNQDSGNGNSGISIGLADSWRNSDYEQAFFKKVEQLANTKGNKLFLEKRLKKGFSESEKYVYTHFMSYCNYLLTYCMQPVIYIHYLMVIQNAFVNLIASPEFESIRKRMVFQNEILTWKTWLKAYILQSHNNPQITFRLSLEQRMELLSTKNLLSYYFDLAVFSELEYSYPKK